VVALEVSVNGKRRYVAGHIDASSLVVMVQVIRPFPEAPVSSILHGVVGVPVEGRQQTDSLPYPSDRLSVGDEVTVRIVEVDSADPPSDRPPQPNTMTFVKSSGSAGRR
jgi:hypothetical protein